MFLSTWYPLFFQKITEGCDINDFIERIKDVSFIIFNYDRCFEYYMTHALCVYYKISKAFAEGIVEKMDIIHPYGDIGDIRKVPLDVSFSIDELLKLSKNIRTFAEDSEETRKERTAIKHLVDRTNRIIFLGFAYHQMNLNLLFEHPNTEKSINSFVHCYGTGYGISENDRMFLQETLKSTYKQITHCEISGDTCAEFFNNFWHRLSFRG